MENQFTIRFVFSDNRFGHLFANSMDDAIDRANFFKSINKNIVEFVIFDPQMRQISI